MIDVFIGSLKDNIQHDVCLWEPDSLEKAFGLVRKIKAKLWQPGSIPLTTIKTEVLLALVFHTYKVDTTTIGRKKSKRALLQL